MLKPLKPWSEANYGYCLMGTIIDNATPVCGLSAEPEVYVQRSCVNVCPGYDTHKTQESGPLPTMGYWYTLHIHKDTS